MGRVRNGLPFESTVEAVALDVIGHVVGRSKGWKARSNEQQERGKDVEIHFGWGALRKGWSGVLGPNDLEAPSQLLYC